jgi:hypothetical protein
MITLALFPINAILIASQGLVKQNADFYPVFCDFIKLSIKELFRQFRDSPAPSPALFFYTIIRFSDRNRTVMIALMIALDDHAVDM